MASNSILTESEEMYLVSIRLLMEAGQPAPIPLSLLAREMGIASVSVNQMVRKLDECQLVQYSPYKGVSLTEDGEYAAMRVLRHRRLWEVFLVKHLQFPPKEAEHQACQIEHVFPDKAAERLADYLDHPTTSPQGKMIPTPDELTYLQPATLLCQIGAGESVTVYQVASDPSTESFLAEQHIRPGDRVNVMAVTQNGGILLETNAGRVHVTEAVAQTIWVQPVKDSN